MNHQNSYHKLNKFSGNSDSTQSYPSYRQPNHSSRGGSDKRGGESHYNPSSAAATSIQPQSSGAGGEGGYYSAYQQRGFSSNNENPSGSFQHRNGERRDSQRNYSQRDRPPSSSGSYNPQRQEGGYQDYNDSYRQGGSYQGGSGSGSHYHNRGGSPYHNRGGSPYRNRGGSPYRNRGGSPYHNRGGSDYQNYHQRGSSPQRNHRGGSPYRNYRGGSPNNRRPHTSQSSNYRSNGDNSYERRRYDRNEDRTHHYQGYQGHHGHSSHGGAVANFYNQKRDFNNMHRKSLETLHIRIFHNWVKSVIIQKYGEKQREIVRNENKLSNLPENYLYVLDLACGKGGDHKKWLMHSHTALYVGVDLAFESLTEAHKRAVKTLDEIKQNSRYHSNIKFGFFGKDATIPREDFWKNIFSTPEEIEENVKNHKEKHFEKNENPCNYMFDVVSCQMAMHYMLQSEETTRNFLDNCTHKLNDQGVLLLTLPDADAIRNILRTKSFETEQGDLVYNGKHFSLKFDKPSENSKITNKDDIYGQKYDFYLQEAVGQEFEGNIQYVPEFLVEIKNFIELAKEYSLEVRENCNFAEFFKNNKTEYSDLLRQMKVTYSTEEDEKDPAEWEISHCYRTLIFQKVCSPPNRFVFDRSTRDKFIYKYPVASNFSSVNNNNNNNNKKRD